MKSLMQNKIVAIIGYFWLNSTNFFTHIFVLGNLLPLVKPLATVVDSECEVINVPYSSLQSPCMLLF